MHPSFLPAVAGGGVKRRFFPDLDRGAPFCITTAQCHTKSQSQVLLLDAPRRRDTRPSRGRRGAEYVSSRVRQMKAPTLPRPAPPPPPPPFFCLSVLRRCKSALHRDPRPDRLCRAPLFPTKVEDEFIAQKVSMYMLRTRVPLSTPMRYLRILSWWTIQIMPCPRLTL